MTLLESYAWLDLTMGWLMSRKLQRYGFKPTYSWGWNSDPSKRFRHGHVIVLSASCSQFLSIKFLLIVKRNSHNLCVFLYSATISGQLCRESIISQVLCSSVYPFHLIRHSSCVFFDDTLIMSCLRILCTTNSCSPFSTTGIGGWSVSNSLPAHNQRTSEPRKRIYKARVVDTTTRFEHSKQAWKTRAEDWPRTQTGIAEDGIAKG